MHNVYLHTGLKKGNIVGVRSEVGCERVTYFEQY